MTPNIDPKGIEEFLHRASARELIEFFKTNPHAAYLDPYYVGDVLLTSHGTDAAEAACTFLDNFPEPKSDYLSDPNTVLKLFNDHEYHGFQRMLMAKRLNHHIRSGTATAIEERMVLDVESDDPNRQIFAAVALQGIENSRALLHYARIMANAGPNSSEVEKFQVLLAFYALDNVRDETGTLKPLAAQVLGDLVSRKENSSLTRQTAARVLQHSYGRPIEEVVITSIRNAREGAGHSKDVIIPREPDEGQSVLANKNAARLIALFGPKAFYAAAKLVDTFRGPLPYEGMNFLKEYIFDTSFPFFDRALSAVRLRETPEVEDVLVEALKSEDTEDSVIAFLALWEGNLKSLQKPLIGIVENHTLPEHSRKLATAILSRAERQEDYDAVRNAAAQEGADAVALYSKIFVWADWETNAAAHIAVVWNDRKKLVWDAEQWYPEFTLSL